MSATKITLILVGVIVFVFLVWSIVDEVHSRQETQREIDHTNNVAKCMVLTGKSPSWCEWRVRQSLK